MNGVIEKNSGFLLRAGFCDFINDGQFDSGSESYRTDVPEPAFTVDTPHETQGFHVWDGSTWRLGNHLGAARRDQIERLIARFRFDTNWTDGLYLWYQKLVDAALNTTNDDNRYSDMLTYFTESQNELNSKRQAILSETSIATIRNIKYTPTHVKGRGVIDRWP